MGKWILPLFFSTSLFAAPVGNPASPSILQKGLFIPDTVWCQPRASFAEDFISQQQLSCTESNYEVQKTSMSGRAQLGVATWSIHERFDLSMTLGSSANKFRLLEEGKLVEFQTSGGLVWYGDAKLVLIEVKDTSFNLFGEAGGWDFMKGPYSISGSSVPGDAHLKMRFWQAGAAISQRIGFFSPYVGLAVLQSNWKVATENEGTYHFSQAQDTGPIVGCSFSTSSALSLNVEWRGWFENGLNVSGIIRF